MKTKKVLMISLGLLLFAVIAILFVASPAEAIGVALAVAPVAVTVPEKIEDVQEKKENQSDSTIDELQREVKELRGIINSEKIPKENFKSESNIKDEKIQKGRRFIKGLITKNMPEEFQTKAAMNFQNETNNDEGAYLVPTEYYNQIQSMIVDQSVIMRNATIINLNRKELSVPKLSTAPAFAFVNEGAAKGASKATFDMAKFTRHDGGFILLLSKQLIEDNAFDVMGFISQIAARTMANVYDEAGLKGISPIKGGFDVTNGQTITRIGADFAALTYDQLIAEPAAITSIGLQNAKWVMHRTILAAINQMKASTSGVYLRTAQDRASSTLESYPVELSEYAPKLSDTGKNKGMILFGDLKNIWLAKRDAITVSISDQASVLVGETQINLWQQGLVGINFGMSFDINCIFPDAIGLMATDVGL